MKNIIKLFLKSLLEFALLFVACVSSLLVAIYNSGFMYSTGAHFMPKIFEYIIFIILVLGIIVSSYFVCKKRIVDTIIVNILSFLGIVVLYLITF